MFYHRNHSLFQASRDLRIHLGCGRRYLDRRHLLSSGTGIYPAERTNILRESGEISSVPAGD
jgi:hypothetical protein